MPLLQTSGNITADGYGGGAAVVPTYIEDVFSTWLIKTPGSTTAVGDVNNSIDLSTKGGMVWLKDRNFAYDHTLVDTARGATQRIRSNTTNAQASTSTYGFTSFNTNGFTLGNGGGVLFDNGASGTNVVSWTFRKQAKFFDVVTYIGNGSATQTISHNLGSAPGCIMVKLTSGANGWDVYHRSLGTSAYVQLNTTAASTTISNVWGTITSTTFTATGTLGQNDSGATYVAYLFAHDAGGFGLTGTDNVISCGSYTGNGSTTGPVVTLGYEPQWLLVKNASAGWNWKVVDVMRGMALTNTVDLEPNTSSAENAPGVTIYPNATGFSVGTSSSSWNASGNTFIYIAIRRGPMKVPTSGTSVFSPVAQNASNPTSTVTTNFPVDFTISAQRSKAQSLNTWVLDRLRGSSKASGEFLKTNVDGSQQTLVAFGLDNNSGYVDNFWGNATDGVGATSSIAYWNFKRAPSFMDVVCYTGTGANRTVTHNLGVVPELMIVKQRNTARDWAVYTSVTAATNFMYLNATDASGASNTMWNDTTPTSSVFTVGTNLRTNVSAGTYVAYLFATCAGVSKVGSYTGTGALQTVNCGFTSGARFVLIKRTDTTGDWWTYDSARGITSGNDPYLFLNSTAAEVTTTNYVDTDTTGFKVTAAAPAGLNASGGTYIFLAIA